MDQEFLGVYATNEAAPSLGDFPRPLGRRKRLWFVWETPEGRYKVQALNAVCQPMAAPRVIALGEFQQRYTPEPRCPAMPEGYTVSGATGGEAPIPPLFDIFSSNADVEPGAYAFLHAGKFRDDGRLSADDPGLLRNWAEAGSKTAKQAPDPVRIPFDRLVEEVEREAVSPRAGTEQPPPPAAPEADGKEQPEEARHLRSTFVQALLLLRRGEREGAVAMLRGMLGKEYPPFGGAAQLFSEFGLGLRRLGLVKLALAAHRRAKEYAPRNERILFNIARSYHDLGLLDDAREYLEKALAVSPEFSAAKQFLMFLDSGKPKGA